MFSFAQNFEDVILARLFSGQETGFYVDIGASHPTELSVTRYFYDLGWQGVNVEPITENWEIFLRERARDINLNLAVGTQKGSLTFYQVVDNTALSTNDLSRADELKKLGNLVKVYEVNVCSADEIFEKYIFQEVDFLKIDVEGSEKDVLLSLNLRKCRPKVLVIEAVRPINTFVGWDKFNIESLACWEDWESAVINSGYVFGYFDGLNRFYVRNDQQHLLSRLVFPPGVFDNIIPDFMAHFAKELEGKEAIIQNEILARATQAQLQSTVQELEGLLIKGKPLFCSDQNLLEQLWEKEAVIQEQEKAIQAYNLHFQGLPPNFFIRWPRNFYRKLRAIFYPRLGQLYQYTPRAFTLPRSYYLDHHLTAYPKISIVTPSYNQAHFIERTLSSVLDQKYPNLEYFVQDGNSTDESTRILEGFSSSLTGWESRPDDGQSHAINLGFAKTSGEIMAWLNSDDILLPGSLSYVADYFNRHPEVDVVYGHRILIDENDQQVGRWILPAHNDEILSWADYVPQETLFWRRCIWEKVNNQVDEGFRFAMDWDLLIRFRDAGARFARLPRFLGGFRIHQNQKTSANIATVGFQEMELIRKRVLGYVPSSAQIHKAIFPYMLKHVIVDLGWRVKRKLGVLV